MTFEIMMEIVGTVIFVLVMGVFFLSLGIFIAKKFDL